MTNVKKQYGLFTGIAMVVGIVIGSGVFIKAGDVLALSGGDLKISLLAWLIGGIIMITSGFCFAVFASKVTKYNGVIDYIEYTTNRKVGYVLAWLFTSLYYPIIASVVALFAGQYFFALIGMKNVDLMHNNNLIFLFAFILVTLIVVLNYFAPYISSKFQISATVIKLLPILFIALFGLVASIFVDTSFGIVEVLNNPAPGYTVNFGEAVKKTAFAYEGWVCATAINAELKDSKRNLPKALVGGTIAVLIFYLIYYISVSLILGNPETISKGANAPVEIFEKIINGFGGVLFTIFILISCVGTVNGVMISCTRGMYTMSCRNLGPKPEAFSKIHPKRSVSLLSCLYGYGCTLIMLLIWYLSFNNILFFGKLGSMDEMLCAIIYAVYIFLYIHIMKNFKDKNVFVRFVMPIIAIIGAIFFTICGTGILQLITTGKTDSLIAFLIFIGLLLIVTIPCIFFYRKEEKEPEILI